MPIHTLTPEIINIAIEGFEAQKARIDSKIADLRAMLPGASVEIAPAAMTEAAPHGKRRRFSHAALQRMREAQQRRWAKVRGESAPPVLVKPEPAKRKLSKAGRANIVAALKKRWAEKKAAAKKTVIKKAAVKMPAATAAKKKMSPARRAALVANLAKAREARAAKRAAAAG